mmetsp:Transcript_121472/g.388552  ORF Transcript_121472/g.388552 Transcript_121472/m.388552 type:complete len:303 (-) Transcript_121472:9-917(-)
MQRDVQQPQLVGRTDNIVEAIHVLDRLGVRLLRAIQPAILQGSIPLILERAAALQEMFVPRHVRHARRGGLRAQKALPPTKRHDQSLGLDGVKRPSLLADEPAELRHLLVGADGRLHRWAVPVQGPTSFVLVDRRSVARGRGIGIAAVAFGEGATRHIVLVSRVAEPGIEVALRQRPALAHGLCALALARIHVQLVLLDAHVVLSHRGICLLVLLPLAYLGLPVRVNQAHRLRRRHRPVPNAAIGAAVRVHLRGAAVLLAQATRRRGVLKDLIVGVQGYRHRATVGNCGQHWDILGYATRTC